MTIKMPYGNVEIRSIEDAIHFIKYRCNDCCYSNEMWSCSSYQASICEAKEQELIQALKKAENNGWKEIV